MKKLVLIFLLLFSTQLVFAWGQNGHRIVAQICYDNLSDRSKIEIDEILDRYYLTQLSTWPDFIRSNKNWAFTFSWHYTTVNSDKTVQQVIDAGNEKEGIQDVMEAIEFMTLVLKDDVKATQAFENLMKENNVESLANSTKATALAFLIHFVGDIHQPMHVGKNRDLGGNKIKVMFFSEKESLHAIWDTDIIEKQQLSFSEYTLMIEKNQAANKARWEKDKVKVWAEESVELREEIYNTLYDRTNENGLPELSYDYMYEFVPRMEERLAAAGYRAAFILNSIFDN
ncbi:S1/P1 nuclease [Sediminitomix flava]|uniref:S1/P1 nuclease n=1 Tax=Sediminitomix flava TaxID=379075 RepID=A0A316A4P1_SEDFL|nr:S1/P1 nuclease [Sediminitomix flava]PWJ44727.1 S1/P1 nuclease [Sediminitomix flava]